MSCSHCVNAIKNLLEEIGINNATVDLTSAMAVFEGTEEQKTEAIKHINESGIYKINE